MPSKADIQASMGLDSNPFRDGMKGNVKYAKKATDKMTKNTASASKEMIRSLSGVGAALGLSGIAMRAIEAGHEIKVLADISGTSAEQFQRQAHAAKTVSIESEKLGDIYKDVQDKVGQFLRDGSGPMEKFFTNIAPKVGVTAEHFRDLSGPDALQLYYDSISNANVSQSEMIAYMEEIASDVTALIPLLQDGGAEFKRLGQEARVMANDTVQDLSDARNRIDELSTSATVLAGNAISMGNTFFEEMAKVVYSITDGRNIMVDYARAEFYAAEEAERLAVAAEKARIEAEKAAAKQADYNQRLADYNAYQAEAAAAAERRAEAEKALQEEFRAATQEYIANAELDAMRLRAAGDLEAAKAMDLRIAKMKEADRIARKHNISLEEAANLVQQIAERQSSSSAGSGSGSGSGSSSSGSSSSSSDSSAGGVDANGDGIVTGREQRAAESAARKAATEQRRAHTAAVAAESRAGLNSDQMERANSMSMRERGAGLYNSTLGRNAQLTTPSMSAAPSARETAQADAANAGGDSSSGPATEATLDSIRQTLAALETALQNT